MAFGSFSQVESPKRLENDLNSADSGKGGEKVAFDHGSDVGGTSNKVNIDIIVKRERVNLLRGIPQSEWNAIRAKTSTLDLSTYVQNAVNYCASNHAFLELPYGRLNFTNILLPSSGIIITGTSNQTVIHNSSLTTNIFKTATGRNLWIELQRMKFISKNLATADALLLQDFEHLSLDHIEVSTLPAERTAGTVSGINIKRTAPGSAGYYLETNAVKVDKHAYGARIQGISGANCNANNLRGLVTNDNTNAGIRVDWCSGLKIRDGSAELNANNIEIFDSKGVEVSGYYMERPVTHNIHIIRGDICKVLDNPILSSAGAGAGGSGATPDANGRAVYIQESVGVDVMRNGFYDPWSFYDVEVTANSSAANISDNRKRHRTNGFTQYKVEVLDSAGDSTIRNYEKTPGGTVQMADYSGVKQIAGAYQTQSGKELAISGSTAKIYSGAGTPEGAVTASRGSIYLRNNGGGGFTFYVKETGDATNTGWVAK